jgi:hypothetical protein
MCLGGFGSSGRQTLQDGTDFGDGPSKNTAGTGANTAPLGNRGGFGSRGRAGTNGTRGLIYSII